MSSSPRSTLDFSLIRAEFPILSAAPTPGRPSLVYLDSAATTQKPRAVVDALTSFYLESNANIHRGVYELSLRASDLYESARATVAVFIGASSPDECVFVRNTTEAINLVASGLRRSIGPGDLLVSTAQEHHSNLVPWQLLAEETGAELGLVGLTSTGELDFDELVSLLERRPRILAVTHCSNVLGVINDIQAITQLAHRFEVPVLVDGAQSAPHFPVDVQALDCDFYAFSGHKALGPTGIGVLYGKAARLQDIPPLLGGGGTIRLVGDQRSTWTSVPNRFEAGTPAIAEAIALAAALDFLRGIGLPAILQHEQMLAAEARRQLASIPGLTIHGPSETPPQTGTLSFGIEGISTRHIAEVLDRQNIAVRAGQHCAQPLLRRLGVEATVRASFYLYNTAEEIDRLIEGVLLATETSGNAGDDHSLSCAAA